MNEFPYNTLNAYYRTLFGKKTAKISIDAGFTCPNRDGTVATGGCIFCSAEGSGDFAEKPIIPIPKQMEVGKLQTLQKWQDACYIAYFQAFSNTYAPVEELREKYTQAISSPDVVGLSVATRPDCFNEEIYQLLQECNERTKVWVELGLQTANQDTARLIHRCYPNETFVIATKRLHEIGIPVVAHVIIGLPNETIDDVLETIRFLNALPIHGIKLHLMHVIKETPLANLYEKGKYQPLEKEEYIEIIGKAIAHLRPDIVIYRLTGDGKKEDLIAPLWSLNKRDVLNSIHKMLRDNQISQGDSYN